MNSPRTTLPDSSRVALTLLLPLFLALFGSRLAVAISGESVRAELPLAILGLTSWFIGLQMYGLTASGMRGGRPLFAGVGFAVLGWIVFLVCRFFLVEFARWPEGGAGTQFLYLLLFEAFCAQIFAFGPFFRSVADWRGPIAALAASAVVFGTVGYLFFQESFITSLSAYLYFVAWGIFYGVIRLRSGSLLGMFPVQALQSLTAWYIIQPQEMPAAGQLGNLYLASTLLYFVIVWRLWPKEESDYRV